jgi:hypothetical protein
MNTDRRHVLALMGGALAAPMISFAQQPVRVARIGYLYAATPGGVFDARLQAFKDALRELGYVEGKNFQLEIRSGGGRLERMPALAAELVAAKVA